MCAEPPLVPFLTDDGDGTFVTSPEMETISLLPRNSFFPDLSTEHFLLLQQFEVGLSMSQSRPIGLVTMEW